MPEPLRPDSEQQIQSILAQHDRVLAVGNRTKPPLSQCADTTLISLGAMTGMIQYEPSEFTFTAYAGTRVSDIESELHSRRQYLPFDPLLLQSGATLGGTVASGVAGPGRFRYGGVRDFLLGARLLCGDGAWTNVGGKVVKNAAGFDVPKMLVGSLGRFGLISEMTFKVFPRPVSLLTLKVACEDDRQAVRRIANAAASRWELDAIEYAASSHMIYLRLGGPHDVNDSLSREIESKWGSDVSRLEDFAAAETWAAINELRWQPSLGGSSGVSPGESTSDSANGLSNESGSTDGSRATVMDRDQPAFVIKVPTTPKQFLSLRDKFAEDSDRVAMHLSVAGATTWMRFHGDDRAAQVRAALNEQHLVGLCVQGPFDSPWIGQRDVTAMERRIKDAIDPPHKFPSFEPVSIGANLND